MLTYSSKCIFLFIGSYVVAWTHFLSEMKNKNIQSKEFIYTKQRINCLQQTILKHMLQIFICGLQI